MDTSYQPTLIHYVLSYLLPALVTIITTLWMIISKEKQTFNRIRIHQTSSMFSTPDIPRDIRESVKIFYKGVLIDGIKSHILEIGNTGRKTIEKLKLVLCVFPKMETRIQFIETIAIDHLGSSKIHSNYFASGKHGIITIDRDFLNPYKVNKEEVLKIVVYSNTSLFFYVGGGDKDWSIEPRSREPIKKEYISSLKLRKIYILAFFIIILTSLFIFVSSLFNASEQFLLGFNITLFIGWTIFLIFYMVIPSFKDIRSMINEQNLFSKRETEIYNDPEVKQELKRFIKFVEKVKDLPEDEIIKLIKTRND